MEDQQALKEFMSDSNLSLIRAALKIGGGFLVARGIASNDQIETIAAGLIAVAAVVWGYLHRKASPATPTPSPKAP